MAGMPAVGLKPERPLLGLLIGQIVTGPPSVAWRRRLGRLLGVRQRLEMLMLVDVKTVVRKADRLDVRLG